MKRKNPSKSKLSKKEKTYTKPDIKKSKKPVKNLERATGGMEKPQVFKVIAHHSKEIPKQYFVKIRKSINGKKTEGFRTFTLKKLKEEGLNVEELVKTKGPHGAITTRYLGKPFNKLKGKISPEKSEELTKAAFNLIGELHQRKIVHNHPHPSNFVYRKGEVGIIDSKFIQGNKKLDWSKPHEIFSFFYSDYDFLCDVYEYFYTPGKRSRIYILNFYRELMNHYPTTEQVKNQVIKKIKQEFDIE